MSDTAIQVRPPEFRERAFVAMTARAETAERCGGRFAHFDTVIHLVGSILDASKHSVAVIPGLTWKDGLPEVQGFVIEDERDGSVEFLHLRRTFKEMSSPTLGARVVKALLGERTTVVMRRVPSNVVLAAMLVAGVTPVVRPRAV